MVKQLARRVLPAAGIVFAAAIADAAIWVVSPSGPFTSIQAAISQAHSGDIVSVASGTYHERLVLASGVQVVAQTPGTAVVDAEGEGSAVTAIGIGTTTTVSGFVFRGGSAIWGGGLYALASSPTFADCTFDANSAVLGGGAYCRDGSRASFVRCTFANNVASVGGGVYLDFAPVSLSACVLRANVASDGSALAANNAAEASLIATCVQANQTGTGSVLASNDASPSYTNCTIVANTGGGSVFGLRGSGTRVQRCIVALNAPPAFACEGSSGPWVDCNILWANGSNAICAGDQNTNRVVDPFFCNAAQDNFQIAANSPAAAGTCGSLGAYPVACAAQGVETAVQTADWTFVKQLYRH